MATIPHVLDLSHYQPTPDWQQIKAYGVLGVILKATEGASNTDATFQSRWIAAKENGLYRSAYHFLRPGDMDAQMQRFFDTVAPSPTERLIIDWEDDDVSLTDCERAADYLLGTGREVTIYGSNVLVEKCKGQSSMVLEQTSLWQARYASSTGSEPGKPPEAPDIWPTWTLWQYSQNCRVPGINAAVDGNLFNGDPANLGKWFDSAYEATGPEPPKPPVVPDAPPMVEISIVADRPIIVIVNGQEVLI